MRRYVRLFLASALFLSLPAIAQTVSDTTKQGYEQLGKGDCKAAFDSFAKSLKADARDGAAGYGRALTFSCALKFEEATKAFAAYEKAGGRNPLLDYDYGVALVRTGQFKDGAARLERARQVNPKAAPSIDLQLGLAYAGENRFDDAERVLKTPLAEKSTRPNALLILAGVEKMRGNETAAKTYLDQLQSEAPASNAAKAVREIAAQLAKKS